MAESLRRLANEAELLQADAARLLDASDRLSLAALPHERPLTLLADAAAHFRDRLQRRAPPDSQFKAYVSALFFSLPALLLPLSASLLSVLSPCLFVCLAYGFDFQISILHL